MVRTRAKANLQRFAYSPDVENKPPVPTTVDIEDIAPVAKRRRTEPAKPAKPVKEKPAKTKTEKTKPEKTKPGKIVEPPPHWKEMYDAVKDMREKNPTAPVDTMGCAELYWRASSVKDQRFHILVALMLSSQTKDTVTAVAMQRLHTELGQETPVKDEVKETETPVKKEEDEEKTQALGDIQVTKTEEAPVKKEDERESTLTLDNILKVSPERLNSLIHTVGFHNNKTKYIKATATILASQYGGDIPHTAPDLMKLPGVGPKMAYLCMSAAWGQHDGIGVDVHVHRITNLWKWHSTRTPEETREALQSWLPKDRWHEINKLLVGLGQTVCLPVGRKCGECVLAGGLCPSER